MGSAHCEAPSRMLWNDSAAEWEGRTDVPDRGEGLADLASGRIHRFVASPFQKDRAIPNPLAEGWDKADGRRCNARRATRPRADLAPGREPEDEHEPVLAEDLQTRQAVFSTPMIPY